MVVHCVRTDHFPQTPDEALRIVINVQHALVLHLFIVGVQFAVVRLVQTYMIGIFAVFEQYVFQQERLARPLSAGNNKHLGFKYPIPHVITFLIIE
ncbi:hypothetical protein D3C80_1955240 [compost metagenome]